MHLNTSIRIANIDDSKCIVNIYNEAIINRKNAILDEINLIDYQNEFKMRDLVEYPIFVAISDENIIGWISISPYRANRRAYSKSKEVSFYIDSNFIGKGIGTKLLQFVIDSKKSITFDNLFAILLANNQASINLLKKFGFSLWGYMPKVLDMDGSRNDALIYGKNFV